jgi:hypothetical protein
LLTVVPLFIVLAIRVLKKAMPLLASLSSFLAFAFAAFRSASAAAAVAAAAAVVAAASLRCSQASLCLLITKDLGPSITFLWFLIVLSNLGLGTWSLIILKAFKFNFVA